MEDWKSGRLEGKGGRGEEGKRRRVEDWMVGWVEEWKRGRGDGWKSGRLEGEEGKRGRVDGCFGVSNLGIRFTYQHRTVRRFCLIYLLLWSYRRCRQEHPD